MQSTIQTAYRLHLNLSKLLQLPPCNKDNAWGKNIRVQIPQIPQTFKPKGMKGSLVADTVLTLYKVTLNQLIFLLLLVKGKRKADSTEKSVTKKAKLVNDGMSEAMTARWLCLVTCFVLTHLCCVILGFCAFVGNLNHSKTYDEVKDALASYFMTQSLLVQDIRLDQSKWVPCSTLTIQYKAGRLVSQNVSKSCWSPDVPICLVALWQHKWLKLCVGFCRKHAYVDLASELDLTKALTLNGEPFLDKKLRVEKAKVKTEVKTEIKKGNALSENQKGNNTSLPSQSFQPLNFVPLISDFDDCVFSWKELQMFVSEKRPVSCDQRWDSESLSGGCGCQVSR